MESSQNSPGGWLREKITFDAAYGGDRITAYLFLPRNASGPLQTVIYFPGLASLIHKSSEDLETYYEFPTFLSFVVKSGRAVFFPVYKGTFERGDPALARIFDGADSHLYTEFLIKLVKDLRRCLDYLETRPDTIDSRSLAYYGMSWGGNLGAIIPAVEERLKASVLVRGRLTPLGRPEARPINYVTRVRTPTLLVAGRYDVDFDTGVKPLFDLLGTPAEHKRLFSSDTDGIPPMNEFIKEALAWLDRYLGPVKR